MVWWCGGVGEGRWWWWWWLGDGGGGAGRRASSSLVGSAGVAPARFSGMRGGSEGEGLHAERPPRSRGTQRSAALFLLFAAAAAAAAEVQKSSESRGRLGFCVVCHRISKKKKKKMFSAIVSDVADRHPPSPGVTPWASAPKTVSVPCGFTTPSSSRLSGTLGRRMLFSRSKVGMRAAVSRENLIGSQHGDQFPERAEAELPSLLGA